MRNLLQIDGKSLLSPLSSKSRLAWSVLIIPLPAVAVERPAANPTGTQINTDWLRRASDTRLRILVSPGSSRPGSRIPQAISTTVSVAVLRRVPFKTPASHRTSPGSTATKVRAVCPAAAMNPFELSSGLPARRSYLSSLRCPRLPSGHSRTPNVRVCGILRTLYAVSAVGYWSASFAVPALCHQHHVWDRRSRGPSVQR